MGWGLLTAAFDEAFARHDWIIAAKANATLSFHELGSGKIYDAVRHAREALAALDKAAPQYSAAGWDWLLWTKGILGHAYCHKGDRFSAMEQFDAIRKLMEQFPRQGEFEALHLLQFFQQCDHLLQPFESGVWARFIEPYQCGDWDDRFSADQITSIWELSEQGLARAESLKSLPQIGLSFLTQARIELFRARLAEVSGDSRAMDHLRNSDRLMSLADRNLRNSGFSLFFPLVLLTRAFMCFVSRRDTGVETARSDLDEAWEIARRGSMKLHLADIHLHRARLFFREAQYPWESPQADVAAAEKLINECGYHRRDEELAGAKEAILRARK